MTETFDPQTYARELQHHNATRNGGGDDCVQATASVPFISGPDFVAGFKPPEYLVDGIVQRHYLYALTGQMGDGKTSISLYLARCVEHGQRFADRDVAQGRVLVLCGENDEDFRARLILSTDAYGLPITESLTIIPSIFDIGRDMQQLRDAAEKAGGIDLVIVDTGPAYFSGDQENDNVQAGQFARTLRGLTTLAGHPAVVVNCHPTKNANRDERVPRGGGAFLAEIDGNLTLYSDTEGACTLHHHRKFRGPGFEPIEFTLAKRHCEALTDTKGRRIPSVVAFPASEEDTQKRADAQRSDEDAILDMMLNWPNMPRSKWCKQLGWLNKNGQTERHRVHRALKSLQADKLVTTKRGRPVLTSDGKKEAQRVVEKGAR